MIVIFGSVLRRHEQRRVHEERRRYWTKAKTGQVLANGLQQSADQLLERRPKPSALFC